MRVDKLDFMVRTALVLGGAGFIGSYLAKKLSQKKYKVIVYDDLSNGSGSKNLSKEIRVIKGSILNPTKLKSMCKKADVIFNLAVKPLPMSFDRPDEVVRVNDYGAYIVSKICTVPYVFCLLNFSALIGFLRFAGARQDAVWEKARK